MRKNGRYGGFILKDFLISLVIVMVMFPIVTRAMAIVSSFKLIDERLIDEIAILHLQRRLVLANEIDVTNTSISYTSEGRRWELLIDDDRIYLTPGYQLFLDDVEDAYFYSDSDHVYLFYIKGGKEYEKIVTIS